MKKLEMDARELLVSMSIDEVNFLCNAINEALQAVDAEEFQTRTGETVEFAQNLWNQLGQIANDRRKLP